MKEEKTKREKVREGDRFEEKSTGRIFRVTRVEPGLILLEAKDGAFRSVITA